MDHSALCPSGRKARQRRSDTMSKADFRVIQVFPYSARVSGGHANAILAFLESLLQRGLDAQALSPAAETLSAPNQRSLSHLPIHELNFDAADFCQTALAAASGAARVAFHLNGITPPMVKLAHRLQQASIPYVCTSHGQLNFRNPWHWLKKFLYLNLADSLIRRAAGLHFLTQREAERRRLLLPAWRGTLLIQHNLVAVPALGELGPLARENFGLPRAAFVFAYLGRLDVDNKGLDLLVKAFAAVAAETMANLVLIGPDWRGGKERLSRLANRLGCRQHLHFLGARVGDDKWRALRMADAFVSPSRWEAFGLAQAEAIAFGLPTIVSDRMNLAPELAERRAALVCRLDVASLASAMRRLMEEETLRRTLAEHGQRWARETCSAEAAGGRFEAFYRQVLGEQSA